MKKALVAIAILFCSLSFTKADAQFVRTKPGFSLSISVGPQGIPPFPGAIWIGPEWAWRNGRYVEVPGYWGRPRRHAHNWNQGHWVETRHGYRWESGRWR